MLSCAGLSLVALDKCQDKKTDFKLRIILAGM
jgi:hypothetical protein